MEILKRSAYGYAQDPTKNFGFEKYDGLGNPEVVLIVAAFERLACWEHLGLSEDELERIKKKKVVRLEFEEPNKFFQAEDFDFYDHEFYKVFTLCPFTAEYLNRQQCANKREPIFFPFNGLHTPPRTEKKFDIIYASFLVEHLQSGNELFSFISNCKKILKKNGIIVFLAPDCLKQKWEFWNIDYTHAYPTTKRNVSMAFKDNGIDDVDVISFNGLMTYKFFWNKFLTWLAEGILVFYNHKILNFIFYPVHRRRIYELDNVFYKGYCFIKQKNIMFIAKNNLF